MKDKESHFSWASLLLLLLSFGVLAKDNEALLEDKLDYQIKLDSLREGDFQYFYTLLKQVEKDGSLHFKNLTAEQSKTKASVIADFFLPLDVENLWEPKEEHYLAVSKFSYLLPISIEKVDEDKFTSKEYLQQTLPQYEVTKIVNGFHVGGSFMTPDFNVSVRFLKADDPKLKIMKQIDPKKMTEGKMKVSFMQQDSFGRVMFFRTAKMASALIIYEYQNANETLVTQYILSNIITVPTKSLIRQGMIENLQNVVIGSRAAVIKF